MNVGSRGFRGRSGTIGRNPMGEQTENVGNRKTFDEIKIPPDNIGNKDTGEYLANFSHDGEGNSLDGEPAHLKSGILSKLINPSGRFNNRNRKFSHSELRSENEPRPRVVPPSRHETRGKIAAPEHKPGADTYMAKLNQDFARLLRLGSGLPFSFSMKAINDTEYADLDHQQELTKIHIIIEDILSNNNIEASVCLNYYNTNSHKFAVYFIKPTEVDPVKNKELIAALRQVVNGHAARMVKAPINIFLVLANARSLIEEHLTKLGAVKG